VLATGAGASPSLLQQAKFVADDAAARDYFGASAALSGDTALVGAFNKSSDAGAAYVFTKDVAGWTQQARLFASDSAVDDDFGLTTALEGDTAVVGADSKFHAHGAVYVFVRAGSTWTQQAKLVPDDSASGDYFGASLALSGDTIVVGAFNKDAARGAAYVFVHEGDTWTQQAKIVADDGVEGDAFGVSVALDGDTAVIGAYGPNGGAGGAYVFTRSAATWTLSGKLATSDGESGDGFGGAVAVRGDEAVVGAFAHGGGQGAVYLFRRDGLGAWNADVELKASDGAARDYFGTSVSYDGALLAVGADYHDGGKGEAYVFKRVDSTWGEAARLVADDAVNDDHLGYGLAVDRGVVLTGAYGKDGQSGSAYSFTGIPDPAPPPIDPPPGDGGGGPPKPTFGIASAAPMQLSQGASILVLGTGFSLRPRAWLSVGDRKIALRVQKGANGGRLTGVLASIPRNVNGPCSLNVLPRGSKTPYVLDGLSIELPNIVDATPDSPQTGAPATVHGVFFGTKKGRVILGGRRCRVRAWHDTSISVIVPKRIAPGETVDVEVDNVVGAALNVGAFTR